MYAGNIPSPIATTVPTSPMTRDGPQAILAFVTSTTPNSNHTDDVIRALEERLWAAQLAADVATLDELIADDLLFAGPTGELATKAEDLEQHRSGALKITKLVPVDYRLREIPGGAITSVLMDGAAIVQGQPVSGLLRYTRVWIQENGRWRIAGGHLSMLR